MNYHKNDLRRPKEERSVPDINGCERKEESMGHERSGTVVRYETGAEEEESFVRFELPLIITCWIVFLIIFGYFVYW